MARADMAEAKAPVRRGLPGFTDQLIEPLSRLRNEVDRLFDDLSTRMPVFQPGRRSSAMPGPAIEMAETSKAFKLNVEVPGMEAGDVEVSVDDDILVITGEKKEERKETEEGYFYSERTYGAFERRIQMPAGVDAAKVSARVHKGVLQIVLPKDAKAESRKRRIAVEAS